MISTPRTFLIVDPLDGTKEFVQRRGDFTVNIALVEDGVPVRGMVYAPAKGRLFYTTATGRKRRGNRALRPETVGEVSPIGVARPTTARYSSSRRNRTATRRRMTISRNTRSPT
jgi:3'(2'), 5'-bisphosphate nucleotidase